MKPIRQISTSHVIETPIEFAFDQDTGSLSLVVVALMKQQTENFEFEPFQMNLILQLTRETSRTLLADLPKLATLLERASKDPAKPDFLQ